MTVWSSLAIDDGPVSLLRRDIETGRVAHAYLFGGIAGRLPIDTAHAFAAALVCAEGGCGACDACLRVEHRAHPDVELIEPAGMQLLVEQVREAIRSATRRPVAGARHVIIVDGADRMNPNAQNAFLKALEEPPASTTIILIAPAADVLLETVRSRCREVAFHSPPPAEVARLLEEQGVGAEQARYFARIGGDIARAVQLATDEPTRTLRHEVVERALQVFRDPGDALDAAEWLASRTKDIRDRVAEEHRTDRDEYKDWYQETKKAADDRLRREQRRAEQDALEASIDDIASVLRDLLVVANDREGQLLNEHVRGQLQARVEGLRGAESRILACLTEVERCRRRLRANANVLLTLESTFLALYKGLA